jgi:hypothetical protein
MNDWNQWENLLRSWTPRPPSARLRKRVFASGAQIERPDALASGGSWRWLAPALGCLLLVSTLSGTRNNRMAYLAVTSTNNLLDLFINNRSYAAYIVPGFHSDRNALKRESFEWTSGRGSISSMGSFPLMITNSLIR